MRKDATPASSDEVGRARRKRFCYEYPRPMVTVDVVTLRLRETEAEVLLVKRKAPPHMGRWALPGGFIRMNEPLEEAALRELGEETGIRDVPFLMQLGAYGDPKRDPRGRVVSVAFIAILHDARVEAHAASDAAEVSWFPVRRLPLRIAFDHERIIGDAIGRIISSATNTAILFAFLPHEFTESRLQSVLDAFFGRAIAARPYLDYFSKTGLVRRAGRGRFRLYRP